MIFSIISPRDIWLKMTADHKRRARQAKVLRLFRKVHRWAGASLFVFFFFVSISGLLLGWKKHAGELIMPSHAKGSTDKIENWLPLDSLTTIANQKLELSNELSELSKIDIRPDKGIVKFIYENNYEIQLDGQSGFQLNEGRRHSDWIEKLHDGSIVDGWLNFEKGQFKLLFTSTMGISLLIFTATGFWLWQGPKQMRRANRH